MTDTWVGASLAETVKELHGVVVRGIPAVGFLTSVPDEGQSPTGEGEHERDERYPETYLDMSIEGTQTQTEKQTRGGIDVNVVVTNEISNFVPDIGQEGDIDRERDKADEASEEGSDRGDPCQS